MEDQISPTPDVAGTSDRRKFITRASVGTAAAGALWIAPSVLSIDAASASPCPQNAGLIWSQFATGSAPGAFPTTGGPAPVTVTVGGLNPNNVASNGGTGSLGNCFRVISSTIGGTPAGSKAWYMQMNVTTSAQSISTTFTFSKPVVGLTFSVFDIDSIRDTSQNPDLVWQDRVTVTAVDGATSRNVRVTKPGGTNSPVLVGNNVAGTAAPTATGTGNTNLDPLINRGNAVFSVPTAVTTVTVRYTNPNSPGQGFGGSRLPTSPIQFVAIGDLTWSSCV